MDKDSGLFSRTAGGKIARMFETKKFGHIGTLDPMATGVLPILVGRATRLSSFLIDADKRYTAKIKFGITTDTLDITGKILSEQECDISLSCLEQVLPQFKGEISQVPPMYSAIKKDGVRLYELARLGKTVERASRTVEIKEINILEKCQKNEFLIDVLCSKGTYIRTLAGDLGEALGVGATLTELTRTMTGGFLLKDCLTKQEIIENPQKALLSPDLAVNHFENVYITENQKTRFLHGGELSLDRVTVPSSEYPFYKVYYKDEFLGLGEKTDKDLKVKCIITE